MIKLRNRDRADLWIDDDGLLHVDDEHNYCIRYLRCGYKEHPENYSDENVAFIDPPGGPMLSVGDIIGGKTIAGFAFNSYGVEIKFKNNEKDNKKDPKVD